jgi:hypothetical protein
MSAIPKRLHALDLGRLNLVSEEQVMGVYTDWILVMMGRSPENVIGGKPRCSLLACLYDCADEIVLPSV